MERQKVKVFLGYSRKDRNRVIRLNDDLNNVGFDTWIDYHNIQPGEIWEQSIKEGIRSSDVFLFCLSQNSVSTGGYLQKELQIALDAVESSLSNFTRLIPVLLEPCEIPQEISRYQAVDLEDPDGFLLLADVCMPNSI